jgi:hypothetical protein
MNRFLAAALILAAGQAVAQNYPARPVRMLIGFTPGTATDIVARVLGQKLVLAARSPPASSPRHCLTAIRCCSIHRHRPSILRSMPSCPTIR